MARGPAPKATTLRQRRNRTTTAAELKAIPGPTTRRPKLPIRIVYDEADAPVLDELGQPKVRPWHPFTVAAWRDWWRSPMAAEWLRADWHGLYILADLWDRYWYAPSSSLATLINQHRAAFGLTPIDRRRLQWEIQKIEKRQVPQAPRISGADPPDPRQ